MSLWFINRKIEQAEHEVRHLNFRLYEAEKLLDKLYRVKEKFAKENVIQEAVEDALTQYLHRPIPIDRTRFGAKVYNHTKKIKNVEVS